MNILKTSIKQTCQTQLTNHQYWKLATVAMSEQSKANISNTACGCVADKAPESVSMTELATAAIDPSARTQIAQKNRRQLTSDLCRRDAQFIGDPCPKFLISSIKKPI